MLTFTIAALLFARAVNTIEVEFSQQDYLNNLSNAPPSLSGDDAPSTSYNHTSQSQTYVDDCMNAPDGVFDDYGNCVFVPPPYTKSQPEFPITCENVPDCEIIYPPRNPWSNECVYYVEENF